MTRLLCFDMDGVIFEHKNFWMELHKALGTEREGRKLTKKHLHSDYETLVKEVVEKLWKGKSAEPYHRLIQRISYNPGVKEVFEIIKKEGWFSALISSGPIDLARRAQKELGIDHIFANELIVREGRITGEFVWPIAAGYEKKVEIVEHLAEDLGVDLAEVVFVGDSIIDIGAFKIVGTSIAFNCKNKELMKVATHIVEGNDLRKILPYLERHNL